MKYFQVDRTHAKALAFTLLELLLALGLSAACITLAGLHFYDKSDHYQKEEQAKSVHQTCRDALELIAQDLQGIDFSLEKHKKLLEQPPDQLLYTSFQTFCADDHPLFSNTIASVRYAILEKTEQPSGLYRFVDECRKTLIVPGCKGVKVTIYTKDRTTNTFIPISLEDFKKGNAIVYATVELTTCLPSLKSEKLYRFKKSIYLNYSHFL